MLPVPKFTSEKLQASLAAGHSTSELRPVRFTRRAPDSKIHRPTSLAFFRAADEKKLGVGFWHAVQAQGPPKGEVRFASLFLAQLPR